MSSLRKRVSDMCRGRLVPEQNRAMLTSPIEIDKNNRYRELQPLPCYLPHILLYSCTPFYLSPMLPCLELVGNDGGMDTIRFLVADAILEVIKEGLVIRCSKCANNVSCCCCCCRGPGRLRGIHGYGRLRHPHSGEIYTFGSVIVGVSVSLWLFGCFDVC